MVLLETSSGGEERELGTYATAFTRIPFGSRFFASARVKPTIAPFVEA